MIRRQRFVRGFRHLVRQHDLGGVAFFEQVGRLQRAIHARSGTHGDRVCLPKRIFPREKMSDLRESVRGEDASVVGATATSVRRNVWRVGELGAGKGTARIPGPAGGRAS
jgi:hypothetical protein